MGGLARDAFPVLAERAYLNAGTTGPVPAVSARAAIAELEREVAEGRTRAHFERRIELIDVLRGHYARVLSARPEDVALTNCATDGMARVLAGMDLQQGDEVLTSTVEHPGLYGPLAVLRARGVRVRAVELGRLAECVGPRTRLVACSHVSWTSGSYAPAALAELDVPVLLDGAQGVGAVPVDVEALGIAAYAGAGQKWLCGPEGTGMLWLHPDFRCRLRPVTPGYLNLEAPNAGLAAEPWEDARAFDALVIPVASMAASVAALELFEAAGWDGIHARAREGASALAAALAERGKTVLPRDETTLVTWEDADAEATLERAVAAGVVIRGFPGRPLVRASFGAWNDPTDVERLLAVV